MILKKPKTNMVVFRNETLIGIGIAIKITIDVDN